MATKNETEGYIVTKKKVLTVSETTRHDGLLEIVGYNRQALADAQKEVIATEKALAEARRAQKAAYDRVDALAPALNASRATLRSAIDKANRALELKDQLHDGASLALGTAGLVAAGILTGPVALAVGVGIFLLGELNESERQQKIEPDAPGDVDKWGARKDGADFLDDAADAIGSPQASRWGVGVASGAVGVLTAGYEVQSTTASPLEARVNTAQELRGLPTTVDKFTETYKNNAGFNGFEIKQMSRETLKLQEEYDAAVAAAVAADRAATKADATWSDAEGRVTGRGQMLQSAQQAADKLLKGP